MQPTAFLFRALACFAALTPASANEGTTWVRETIHGVRVTLIHAPQSPLQHTFAFSTPGLTGDPARRAQYAHLIEHMLIRTTDPDELETDGLRLNGETSALSIRLDTYAEPDHWRAALERQVRWIRADAFPGELLEREKQRIATEEATTVASGATHKWADAAWGQVVLAGLEHAAVHGDVAEATLDTLGATWGARTGGWHLVSAGPVALEEVRAAMVAGLAGFEAPSAPAAASQDAFPSGAFTATWDLEARHDVEWYALSGSDAKTRMAGMLAAQALHMHLLQDKVLRDLGVQVLVANDLIARGGAALKLSTSVGAETEIEELRAALDASVAAFAKDAAPRMTAMRDMWRMELQVPLDLGRMREQRAPKGALGELFEGQIVLGWMSQEAAIGLPREEWDATLRGLETAALERFVNETFVTQQRSSLLLQPRAR